MVTAESYLQHAEHYLRILAAAQAYNRGGAIAAQQQQYRRPYGGEWTPRRAMRRDGRGEALGMRKTPMHRSSLFPARARLGAIRWDACRGVSKSDRGSNSIVRETAPTSLDNHASKISRKRWDGPQPQFLRRAAPAGSPTTVERSGNSRTPAGQCAGSGRGMSKRRRRGFRGLVGHRL